jgi:hypothetical protein
MYRLINVCVIGALLLVAGPAAAQSSAACHRCTAQCKVCGMGDKCAATCNSNRNPMVQAGPNNCSNWFASSGCKQSR